MQGHDRTREGLRLQHERREPHMGMAIAPKKLMERLRGCSYVMAAGSKC